MHSVSKTAYAPREELDLETLDPGIRRLVKLLRDRGWRTTDSGDGVSKYVDPAWAGAEECLMAEPHVVVSPARSHSWADLIHADLLPYLSEEAQERLSVQFSYSSRDKLGILIVLGVSDEDLRLPAMTPQELPDVLQDD